MLVYLEAGNDSGDGHAVQLQPQEDDEVMAVALADGIANLCHMRQASWSEDMQRGWRGC